MDFFLKIFYLIPLICKVQTYKSAWQVISEVILVEY